MPRLFDLPPIGWSEALCLCVLSAIMRPPFSLDLRAIFSKDAAEVTLMRIFVKKTLAMREAVKDRFVIYDPKELAAIKDERDALQELLKFRKEVGR